MKAPDHIVEAALDTIKWAMVYCRNYTIDGAGETQQIYELMDALHDIPDQLYRWSDDGIDRIKFHLRCFDHTRWEGSPDLVSYFEGAGERTKN